MDIRTTLIASSLIVAALASGSAHAVLEGRNMDGNAATFEAYYDTVLNITWLADANYAQTSGYDVDGAMNWAAANTWAANLSFFNPITNQTYDNWRLPTAKPVNGSNFIYNNSYNGSTDVGYNISEVGSVSEGFLGNEMAHLFYNTLGYLGSCDPSTSTADFCGTQYGTVGMLNPEPFINLADRYYWSDVSESGDMTFVSGGVTYVLPGSDKAWVFSFDYGFQKTFETDGYFFYALAVSPGDIAAVPEAQTYALMLAGLGLVGWRARRRG